MDTSNVLSMAVKVKEGSKTYNCLWLRLNEGRPRNAQWEVRVYYLEEKIYTAVTSLPPGFVNSIYHIKTAIS